MEWIGLKPLQKVDCQHSVVPCGEVPQERQSAKPGILGACLIFERYRKQSWKTKGSYHLPIGTH